MQSVSCGVSGSGEMLEIADLTADRRTDHNPLVTGARHFRAYAGAPLVLRSGAIVGRLCVIDTAPRPEGLSELERSMLRALARLASENLELRRIAKVSERQTELQVALVGWTELLQVRRTDVERFFIHSGCVSTRNRKARLS